VSRKRRNVRRFQPVDDWQAKEIGRRIQQARRETGGMTQKQLAELLNVSDRSVQDFEHGVRVPWRYFQRLEEITGRSLRWFLHGKPEPTRVVDDLALRHHDELLRRLDELREAQRVIMSRLDQLERPPRPR
jgi:transcriptional regulator with XRE-family HTH domain